MRLVGLCNSVHRSWEFIFGHEGSLQRGLLAFKPTEPVNINESYLLENGLGRLLGGLVMAMHLTVCEY